MKPERIQTNPPDISPEASNPIEAGAAAARSEPVDYREAIKLLSDLFAVAEEHSIEPTVRLVKSQEIVISMHFSMEESLKTNTDLARAIDDILGKETRES